MALTLADAIEQVRYVLNETTASFWTDAEITSYIKEGTRVFCSKSFLSEADDIVDPLKETTLYYDSTDETFIGTMLQIYAAIYDDGSNVYKGLIKIHPRQIGNLALKTAGPPKYFCFHNRNLYVFPLSSAAVAASGTIHILYAQETDDVTAIADEYQHLPVLYALSRAKQKDRMFGESGFYMKQFYDEIAFERKMKIGDMEDREPDTLQDFRIKGKEERVRRG